MTEKLYYAEERKPSTLEGYHRAWLQQMRLTNKWLKVSVERGEALIKMEKRLLDPCSPINARNSGERKRGRAECLKIIQDAMPDECAKTERTRPKPYKKGACCVSG